MKKGWFTKEPPFLPLFRHLMVKVPFMYFHV